MGYYKRIPWANKVAAARLPLTNIRELCYNTVYEKKVMGTFYRQASNRLRTAFFNDMVFHFQGFMSVIDVCVTTQAIEPSTWHPPDRCPVAAGVDPLNSSNIVIQLSHAQLPNPPTAAASKSILICTSREVHCLRAWSIKTFKKSK